ncbi:peptidoglycan D,D-transpeptidase FtsI family protein [Oceanirhabdus sp. W0125-5]|uniref:peptidoglycan D,D-transpeptidase FtsI family protein n=1 Tax=Oceanirhabdus sp. W0125-5 TaxID=2999116 RepID=UPI0022F2FC72|nr:penicillin-binding protein 2 [Oceanirhabdus sp. W0125-5]WBW99290.1 penicillin-binding protein 2 [Oceanirhabdus sp. W0125-5]
MKRKSMKNVLVVFLVLFILIISYIGFYYIFNGRNVVMSVYNNRLWSKRREVVRGNILDRDGNYLTESKVEGGTNKLKYNGGKAFAHVLGYMDPVYGLTGLQNTYDLELMGERRGGIFTTFSKKENLNKGYDLKTTLNEKLQRRAYSLMGKSRGAVIMMNPKSGEIYTMVSAPSYDPNYLQENWKIISTDKNSPLINRAVSGMYPPASTFKIITAIAALEHIEGVEDYKIQDTGVLKYNGIDVLTNYESKPHGDIDIEEAFKVSSNVYFGDLGLKLGNKKLKNTAERFYFNKNTSCDGIIIDNSRFPDVGYQEIGTLAQSAIGQNSVLATPMEILITANVIANNGIFMKPFLVQEVLENDKIVKKLNPVKVERIISTKNAKLVKEYMKKTVDEGTGKAAKIFGLNVYGKTGTAEHENTPQRPPHSWFVGFAGNEEPSISFVVLIEEGGVGGGRAATIARELVEYADKLGLVK